MRWLRPSPRAALRRAMPIEPLCTTAAVPPTGSSDGSEVPNKAVRSAKFRKPRQLGPHTAMSWARASVASSRCMAAPCSPASTNPLDSTASPPAPLSAASRATSTTFSACTAMNTASMSPGTSRSEAWQDWPSNSLRLGLIRWMAPAKPSVLRAFQALNPGPILSDAPTMATDRGRSNRSMAILILELRLALLQEGAHAFLGIAVGEYLLAQLLLVLHHAVPGVPQVVGDGLARGQDGVGRGGGDALGDGPGHRHQLGPLHHLADEVHGMGLVRTEVLSQQEDVEGLVAADEAGEAGEAHAPARHDAEIGVAGAEHGVVGGNAVVAGPGDGGAAADAVAVDGRNDRAREGLDALQGAAAVLAEGLAVGGVLELGLLAQVGAGAERPLAGAGEDHAAHLAVGLKPIEGGVQGVEGARRYRVHRRVVERHRGDVARNLGAHERVRHSVFLLSCRASAVGRRASGIPIADARLTTAETRHSTSTLRSQAASRRPPGPAPSCRRRGTASPCG